ncbi:BIR protein [Plasmodium berghei]|uniref:BIR protein n=2 Tax=Plasmodium berghei TaxID=5821 RepID=A0A509ALN7_PLABA|nr:BIR protein [Plasmodium berghei ANKA]CXI13541.1 BIR protein [Plasmodium berghei]SBW38181.1 BIR protein [Plasmodium berghei]SCL82172.1 BIR protein [Plasmodium berghei]SCL82783.1 BIR protein [Plasmodium berghei]SCL83047.1 BIR protein [Plasmodium berghei]|eukprot:XP_034420487.1 BIR protein [Plasmodium berghei ANKA]
MSLCELPPEELRQIFQKYLDELYRLFYYYINISLIYAISHASDEKDVKYYIPYYEKFSQKYNEIAQKCNLYKCSPYCKELYNLGNEYYNARNEFLLRNRIYINKLPTLFKIPPCFKSNNNNEHLECENTKYLKQENNSNDKIFNSRVLFSFIYILIPFFLLIIYKFTSFELWMNSIFRTEIALSDKIEENIQEEKNIMEKGTDEGNKENQVTEKNGKDKKNEEHPESNNNK